MFYVPEFGVPDWPSLMCRDRLKINLRSVSFPSVPMQKNPEFRVSATHTFIHLPLTGIVVHYIDFLIPRSAIAPSFLAISPPFVVGFEKKIISP